MSAEPCPRCGRPVTPPGDWSFNCPHCGGSVWVWNGHLEAAVEEPPELDADDEAALDAALDKIAREELPPPPG